MILEALIHPIDLHCQSNIYELVNVFDEGEVFRNEVDVMVLEIGQEVLEKLKYTLIDCPKNTG